ncbi:MAG: ribosomal-protein-alanine N-acetyltransferase [Deltaproteobacteria bacterium RIFCSPHIGHO2_02_FULL_40_11]|nr:MAG: ribosomal-protein-alanine N-acetyltransferase [Deltaproteobacteria bacterium RIFCSPHIGHO2_02_FULL_40_11]
MSFIIQPAQKTNLPEVCLLEKKSFSDPWPSVLFEQTLQNPDQKFYVLIRDDSVLGYIIFWKIVDEVHILNICVDGEKRKQGLGAALLKFCLSYHPPQDVHDYYLEVRPSNHAAQALYKKFGFKILYTREKYYPDGEDAHVMCKHVQGEF